MTFRHRLMRGLGRGLAGALLFVFAGAAAQADGASVWSIKGKRNTVYLAGSVHALPENHAELSPELESAYDDSGALLMEVDLDDLNPLEAVQFVTSNGTLPEDESLEDVVGAERYSKIIKLADSIDMPELALARLEPWAAAMVLTQFALMKSGFDPQLGIDMQLTARAQADGKPIEGLETVVDQLSIFDSRSISEQTKFLVDAANDVPKMHEDLDRLIEGWRTGDMARWRRSSTRSARRRRRCTTRCSASAIASGCRRSRRCSTMNRITWCWWAHCTSWDATACSSC